MLKKNKRILIETFANQAEKVEFCGYKSQPQNLQSTIHKTFINIVIKKRQSSDVMMMVVVAVVTAVAYHLPVRKSLCSPTAQS